MTEQPFVDVVCARRRRLQTALSVCIALFAVLLVPFATVERGTSSYLITVFQLGTLLPIIVGIVALLLVCRSRDDLRDGE